MEPKATSLIPADACAGNQKSKSRLFFLRHHKKQQPIRDKKGGVEVSNQHTEITVLDAKRRLCAIGIILEHRNGLFFVRRKKCGVQYCTDDLMEALDVAYLAAEVTK